MIIHCDDCGSTNMRRQNARGRKFGFGKWDEVELLVDLDLLTCQECSNIVLHGDAEALKKALSESLRLSKVEAKMAKKKRYQVVKIGPYYQIRFKSGFLSWKWFTETGRKGEQIAVFLNYETAKASAERYVDLLSKIHSKVPGMEVVFDSKKSCE